MSSGRVKEFGPWSEQCSSQGKIYYYNRESEVSQWEKPEEWREYERQLEYQERQLEMQRQKEVKEQEERERRKRKAEDEDREAKLRREEPPQDPFAAFYDERLSRRLYGVGDDLEQFDEATRLFNDTVLQLSMRASQELGLRKSASSLVKTAELRTVLLRHKIKGIRSAQAHLEEKMKEKTSTVSAPYFNLSNPEF